VSNGYPTIFKITNGKLEYYKENRDESTINNWIKKSTPNPHKKHNVSNNFRHTAHHKSRVAHNITKRIKGGKKRNKKHNKTYNKKYNGSHNK